MNDDEPFLYFVQIKEDHKAFWRQLEDKRPVVDGNLLSGRQYVANENLAEIDEQNRELVRSIRREVAKLGEQWHGLLDSSDQWKRRLEDFVTVSLIFCQPPSWITNESEESEAGISETTTHARQTKAPPFFTRKIGVGV